MALDGPTLSISGIDTTVFPQKVIGHILPLLRRKIQGHPENRCKTVHFYIRRSNDVGVLVVVNFGTPLTNMFQDSKDDNRPQDGDDMGN